jgi:hypothetical protein
MASPNYFDFEDSKTKNILNELINLTLRARIENGLDCTREEEEKEQEIKQFTPFWIAKIVAEGVYHNPLSFEKRFSRYRDELEKKLETIKSQEKIVVLIQAADEEVACATLLIPENYKITRGRQRDQMLYWAGADYNRASSLKKSVKKDKFAGEKLAYISKHIPEYVPLIKSVYDLFRRSKREIDSENIKKEIESFEKDETGIPLSYKIDYYCLVRRNYVNNEDRIMDINKRLEIKSKIKDLYEKIKKEKPSFKDNLFE